MLSAVCFLFLPKTVNAEISGTFTDTSYNQIKAANKTFNRMCAGNTKVNIINKSRNCADWWVPTGQGYRWTGNYANAPGGIGFALFIDDDYTRDAMEPGYFIRIPNQYLQQYINKTRTSLPGELLKSHCDTSWSGGSPNSGFCWAGDWSYPHADNVTITAPKPDPGTFTWAYDKTEVVNLLNARPIDEAAIKSYYNNSANIKITSSRFGPMTGRSNNTVFYSSDGNNAMTPDLPIGAGRASSLGEWVVESYYETGRGLPSRGDLTVGRVPMTTIYQYPDLKISDPTGLTGKTSYPINAQLYIEEQDSGNLLQNFDKYVDNWDTNLIVCGTTFKDNGEPDTANSIVKYQNVPVDISCTITYRIKVNSGVKAILETIPDSLSEVFAGVEIPVFEGSKTFKVDGEGNIYVGTKRLGLYDNAYVPVVLKYTKINTGSTLTDILNTMMKTVVNALSKALQTVSGWISGALDWGNNINKDNAALEKIWTNTRNLSLSLLTLAIILIAFANILGFDIEKYGLNRILPKLVIGVGLAFFSFLICGLLLNLASGLQSLLVGKGMDATMTGINADAINTQVGNGLDAARLTGNLFVGAFLLLLVIVIAFFCFLWLLLICILRIMVIMFLVAIAPVAFMMNILPFTTFLFKRWWSTFIKWTFMGPAIIFFLYLTNEFLVGGLNSDFSGSMQPIMYLLLAGVGVAMAAMVPMTLGGEVIRGVQSGFNKGKNSFVAKPVTDRAKAFNAQRKQYGQLKANKFATNLRESLGKERTGIAKPFGVVGGVIAGTRGITGKQDKEIAKKMYIAQQSDKTFGEQELRLRQLGGKNANIKSPEVAAILEHVARNEKSSNWSDETKQLMATAYTEAASLEEKAKGGTSKDVRAASESLAVPIKRAIGANPAEDTATMLFNHALDEEKGYHSELNDVGMKKLGESAARGVYKKSVVSQSDRDVQAIDNFRKHPKYDNDDPEKKLFAEVINKTDDFFAHESQNRAYYEQHANAETQKAHEKFEYKWTDSGTPLSTASSGLPVTPPSGGTTSSHGGEATPSTSKPSSGIITPSGSTGSARDEAKGIEQALRKGGIPLEKPSEIEAASKQSAETVRKETESGYDRVLDELARRAGEQGNTAQAQEFTQRASELRAQTEAVREQTRATKDLRETQERMYHSHEKAAEAENRSAEAQENTNQILENRSESGTDNPPKEPPKE